MNSRVFFIITAVVAFDFLVLRPRRVRKGAGRTLDRMKKIFCGGPHEYRKVSPAEFPRLDHQFYRQKQVELERLGFRFLADVEDVTLARTNPNIRTFVRSMISEDGTIMSAVYDARPRQPFMRLLQLVGTLPRDLRNLDLETEFSDGSFVCVSTSSLAGRMKHPPEIKTIFLPQATPVPQLLETQRFRVSYYMREHPGLQPLRFTSHEEVRAAQNRMNEIKSRYRASIGYMAPGELEQIASPGLKTTAAEMAVEVEKLKREESEKNQAGRG